MSLRNMLIIVALFCCNTFVNAQSFEGIIKMSITNAEKSETSDIVWKMKGEKSRLEYVGVAGERSYNYVLLLSTTEAKAKILSEANGQKVVYTVGIPSSTTDNVKYIDHTYTSSNKMIDGYHTEQVTLKAADRRTSCWVSKEVPLTVDMMPSALKANGVMNYFLAHKIKGVPMEMETIDASGKIIYSQKITSLKVANISENEFVIGSEYVDPTHILKSDGTKNQ